MGGFFISLIFGSNIFVGSKDLLWVYKRSPRNVNGLVYSYLFMLLILLVLIDIGLMVVYSIVLRLNFIDTLLSFVAFLFYGIFAIMFAIGVQCFRPTFGEKGKNVTNNMVLILLIQLGQFIGFLALISIFLPEFPSSVWLPYEFLAIYLSIQAIIYFPILILGLKALKKIE